MELPNSTAAKFGAKGQNFRKQIFLLKVKMECTSRRLKPGYAGDMEKALKFSAIVYLPEWD